MGLVTAEIVARVTKQVEQAGTVVWYDPQQQYAPLIKESTPGSFGCDHLVAYALEHGLLKLRYDLEPTWGNVTQPPRLVIYLPMDRQETQQALIEYEVGGAVIRPGQQPPEQDSSLALVARDALTRVLPPAAVAKIVEQVAAGQLSLAELDRLAEKGVEAQTGALAMIFDSGNAQEIALRFLADATLDAELEERQATGALRHLLTDAFGVSFSGAGDRPADLRHTLARHVLMTDYLISLGTSVPASYATYPLAGQETARQSAKRLANDWRNRRDGIESYVHWAEQVSSELAISTNVLALEPLRQSETFLASELRILHLIEEALLQRTVSQRLRELVQRRMKGFWANQNPGVKKHWEVIAGAADVLAEAARIENALKGKTLNANLLLSNYAHGDAPWCLLDSAQRHLERDFHQFDPDQNQHDGLLKVVALARQRYAEVTDNVTERFIKAYADLQFEIPNVFAQADIYAEFVAPIHARKAYILVDALRYEMARELVQLLDKSWQADLQVALATAPTITDVGMAALMPGAERGITLEPAAGGKLEVIVEDARLKNRSDRVARFSAKATGQVAETTIDNLAPLSKPTLRKRLAEAATILVTATDEIDGIWEHNPSAARRMMDDALNQLRRGINTLLGLGIEHIVVTADHGYLFGEGLSSGDTIDPPGGHTTILKRRVWIGKGGSTPAGVLRRPLSAFGIGGDLELASPTTLACFKAPGGSLEYFHGGLSLPELVIPVLTLKATESATANEASQEVWRLALGSRMITTRFVSVTVEGDSGGLFAAKDQPIRVEIRDGNTTISTPVSATYGFDNASKDAQMKPQAETPQSFAPNTITLMISDVPEAKSVAVYLIDANTGRTLAQLDSITLAISI